MKEIGGLFLLIIAGMYFLYRRALNKYGYSNNNTFLGKLFSEKGEFIVTSFVVLVVCIWLFISLKKN